MTEDQNKPQEQEKTPCPSCGEFHYQPSDKPREDRSPEEVAEDDSRVSYVKSLIAPMEAWPNQEKSRGFIFMAFSKDSMSIHADCSKKMLKVGVQQLREQLSTRDIV